MRGKKKYKWKSTMLLLHKDKAIEGYKQPLIRLANQGKPIMKL